MRGRRSPVTIDSDCKQEDEHQVEAEQDAPELEPQPVPEPGPGPVLEPGTVPESGSELQSEPEPELQSESEEYVESDEQRLKRLRVESARELATEASEESLTLMAARVKVLEQGQSTDFETLQEITAEVRSSARAACLPRYMYYFAYLRADSAGMPYYTRMFEHVC